MTTTEELLREVEKYVEKKSFRKTLGLDQVPAVSWLAQGEYNLNFLLTTDKKKYVLRLNTGSQMNLDNQIAYEFRALEYLQESGVTPEPLFLDDSCEELPLGMLVMRYLPGRSLDYREDLTKAARIFAHFHQVAVPADNILIKEDNPLSGIWNECNDLIQVYLDSPLGKKNIKMFLDCLRDKLNEQTRLEKELMELLPPAIVNTEVNSGNFIIDEKNKQEFLVDWEKPLFTTPLQDLSHFVVPTTTLWKTDYKLSNEERKRFLTAYLQERNLLIKELYKDIAEGLKLFDRFSAFRGISWSAMAWIEYQQPDRLLKNDDTFQTMDNYLKLEFLKELFPEINY